MTSRFIAILAAVTVLLSGCVSNPQQPVALSPDAMGSQAGRIGVAMTPMPKQDTQVSGADCLLCLMVAISANSALTTHAKTLSYEDLPTLKNQVADLVRKKGAVVTVIDDDLDVSSLPDFQTQGPNLARKDFSSLQKKYQIDRLVVINIIAIGFTRSYSAYIPTSDPKGLLRGLGYMVDLKSNTYSWYQPVAVTKSSDGPWDEPPRFPGLTNAYFQALEMGKDSFLKPFAEGAVTGTADMTGKGPATPAGARGDSAQSQQ